MAGVRRRGRRASTNEEGQTNDVVDGVEVVEEVNLTESEATDIPDDNDNDDETERAVPPTAAESAKLIEECIAKEKSASFLITFAGLVLGVLFVFFGFSTAVPNPDIAYAVMIDAGSTGTRAQVFSFQRGILMDTKVVTSENQIVGLGYGAPVGTFFKALLDEVRTAIPGTKRRKSVPLALRATAGLRLSGADVADRALGEARKALNSSGFLVKPEWVSILDEEAEAVGAWTTVNYLNGHLNGSVAKSSATVELGGASLQVVFEADSETAMLVQEARNVAGKDRAMQHYLPRIVTATFGSDERKLVTMNRLGFGLGDFTKKLFLLFDQEGVLDEGNPCFRKGKKLENKILRLGVAGSEEQRTVTGTGDGDFDRCVASAEIVLMQYGPFEAKVMEKMQGDVVTFAFIYDLTVKLGLGMSATQSELVDMGKKLCEGDGGIAEDRDEVCAEYSYVYLLLKEVTRGFQEKVNLKIVQWIDDHLIGWALGTVLTEFQNELEAQTVKV